MARTDRMPVQMPTTDMSCRQALHESTEVAIVKWPQDHVPVVWHQTIAENSYEDIRLRLRQDFFKCRIIRVIVKNSIAGISTVQNVADHSSRRLAYGSWHLAEIMPKSTGRQPVIGLIPFSEPQSIYFKHLF
jgi:hypothetical protein